MSAAYYNLLSFFVLFLYLLYYSMQRYHLRIRYAIYEQISRSINGRTVNNAKIIIYIYYTYIFIRFSRAKQNDKFIVIE